MRNRILIWAVLIVLARVCQSVSLANSETTRNTDFGRFKNDKWMHPSCSDESDCYEKDEDGEFIKKNVLEETSEYWLSQSREFVKAQEDKPLNKNVAKNIIFFLGDGMSMPTLAASRMRFGGEGKTFSFERFPHVGMAKTYCVDYQVADSACTATAYLSGVKANFATIGVSAKVKLSDCDGTQNRAEYTTSIAKWALDAGKSAGLVTTTRVTHASPAGVFANTANRMWESDDDVRGDGCDTTKVDDIAKQLIQGDVGRRLNVILGGGRREFLNQTMTDEENRSGKRLDGRNLIEEWTKMDGNRKYVWNLPGLKSVNANETDYLLGLFETSHLQYHSDVVSGNVEKDKPSLKQMVTKAIEVLRKNEKGYFLFVEGGKIDMAHHGTKANIAIDEFREFSKAIDYAVKTVNLNDTIILVTADHSHTMSYSGYSKRGKRITGFGGRSKHDRMKYLKLGYANGFGYYKHVKRDGGRVDPKQLNSKVDHFQFPTTIPLAYETHGGDDVAVYTAGPWAHLFRGTFEQHVIPHLLAYAACIGEGEKTCEQ